MLLDILAPYVQAALDEISDACGTAMDARAFARKGSPEWHKRTGEILAYGRMSAVLWGLLEAVQGTAKMRRFWSRRTSNN